MREFHLHLRVFEGVFRSVSFNPRILLANLFQLTRLLFSHRMFQAFVPYKRPYARQNFRYFRVRQQYPLVFLDITSAYKTRSKWLAYKIRVYYREADVTSFWDRQDAGRADGYQRC